MFSATALYPVEGEEWDEEKNPVPNITESKSTNLMDFTG